MSNIPAGGVAETNSCFPPGPAEAGAIDYIEYEQPQYPVAVPATVWSYIESPSDTYDNNLTELPSLAQTGLLKYTYQPQYPVAGPATVSSDIESPSGYQSAPVHSMETENPGQENSWLTQPIRIPKSEKKELIEMEKLVKNIKPEAPPCDCKIDDTWNLHDYVTELPPLAQTGLLKYQPQYPAAAPATISSCTQSPSDTWNSNDNLTELPPLAQTGLLKHSYQPKYPLAVPATVWSYIESPSDTWNSNDNLTELPPLAQTGLLKHSYQPQYPLAVPATVWSYIESPSDTWNLHDYVTDLPPLAQTGLLKYQPQHPAAAPATISSCTQSPSGYQSARVHSMQTENPGQENSWLTQPIRIPKSEKKELNEMEKLVKNIKPEAPPCDCKIDGKPAEFGAYYAHLGSAASLPELRQDLESRIGFSGEAIRIEKICYTGKEGKTAKGCPMAKWVIRRASLNEKILVVVKHRPGHNCKTAWIIVAVVVWEGVPQEESNQLYSMLVPKLYKSSELAHERGCATNKLRTCACQGVDITKAGVSFSFGCSWSMFFNGCKYGRSKSIPKFSLIDESGESEVEDRMLKLVSRVTPLFKKIHPIAFRNMTLLDSEKICCRLDCEEGRAFSAVTACVDFCAHSHIDRNDMSNGLTCLVSLTRHRELSKPDDEQLHVLPLYIMDDTDEFGSRESQENKTKTGALEVLTKFESEVRVKCVPTKSGEKDPVGTVVGTTNNEECFMDPKMGGVAIALGHGSVLFECAKHEVHASTALRRPGRSQPSRLSLVFYQHKSLNLPNHGIDEYARKQREKKASPSKNVKIARQSNGKIQKRGSRS